MFYGCFTGKSYVIVDDDRYVLYIVWEKYLYLYKYIYINLSIEFRFPYPFPKDNSRKTRFWKCHDLRNEIPYLYLCYLNT